VTFKAQGFKSRDMWTTVTMDIKNRIATITLNRPERLNAISPLMPSELRSAVETADADDGVHVIILQGAGRAFCAGYDLKSFAELSDGQARPASAWNGSTFDPTVDYRMMGQNTSDFMSLFRCTKPTICKVHGFAVAGGSDIALCADIVIMATDAKIGYPPARVWGIPTTMMWVHRVGLEKAKRMLFTGDLISGNEAKAMGLVLDAVPPEELDAKVHALAKRISLVPRNQLMMSKMAVNSAFEASIQQSQRLATFFDGFARHSPEGFHFQQRAMSSGFHAAIKERDSSDSPVVPDGISMPTFSFRSMSRL